ncbi:SPOSA6832_02500 [Sporobolomyces salmonicolor]|uniref:SPOSA6832_02500-mRNA-1:cds n=1 Tax=Sporidiobolus salmonicolor TaxID=5005 RepID=A0A0D6EMJ6_SPOSA|nr:SPOSA6832_02500 [Sporobolomyces salmonicolor]
MSDEAAKAQSVALKEQGNAAYKLRNFDQAEKLYQQAHEVYQDPTYLNNLAAVYFEQGDYEKAIKTCEQAVDEGREQRADFKLIAKALGRIGTSYIRLGDYDNGIKYLNKSLTEHRTPDILQKLKDAEKEKAEKDRLAYVDPAKADEAREEGNKAFKVSWELPSFYPSFPSRSSLQTFLPSPVRLPSHSPLASSPPPPRATFPDPTNPRSPPSQAGDFATAVQHYTESIKRNPADARGYTNRAAAYTKLLALPEALRDADKAIEVQPDFVKGYIRKSHVLFAMKEYSKALAAIEEVRHPFFRCSLPRTSPLLRLAPCPGLLLYAYQPATATPQAAEKDTAQQHTREITDQLRKVTLADAQSRVGETDEQTYARAMRDPEVQQIMSDPVFQSILQQAQQDPRSLQQHMQNEGIRKKVEVLVRAGIIKTGRP